MNIAWNDHYPEQRVLKHEIQSMLEAFVETLLEELPESEIEGIYFKGSAQKLWESPLDYVPELSDLDIHLLFSDDSSIEKYLGTTQAMSIQSKVETKFFSKVDKPLHVPRPQLVILNTLLREEGYVPSPKSVVSVLYGKDYPQADYSDSDKIRSSECQRIIKEEEYLSKFPLHIIDKPSRYLWDALRSLVWRVSPVGPRVLHILGLETEKAWSSNRTRIVSLLEEMGENQLVQDYAEFYLSGWEYFLSAYSNSNAGRTSLTSGVNTLVKGIEIAKTWLSKYSKGC